MIAIGQFFFKYRNFLFIFLYALLFIPSPQLFIQEYFGPWFWIWPLIIGLVITITGQVIRGATIGLTFIPRSGKDRRVHADQLVTYGIYNHCRNPLYVGNILTLLGVGVLSNSLVYVVIIMPLFMLIYQAIVFAEENFLIKKFGETYVAYCKKVNRWVPSFKGLGATFHRVQFNWKRWIFTESNTLYVWLTGTTLIILFKYPQLTHDKQLRNLLLAIILPSLLLLYIFAAYSKKSKK